MSYMDKNQIFDIIEKIKKDTEKDVLKFTLEDESVTIFDSFVYGNPYIPKNGEWPKDKNGDCLNLLAQINCKEFKNIENFPKEGILQFFIADDDIYGMNFDNLTNNDGFRVIYYKDIDYTVTYEDVLKKGSNYADENNYFPVLKTFKIVFKEPEKEGISIEDYGFNKMFVELYNKEFEEKIEAFWDIDDEISGEIYDNENNNINHKCGGYPFFTQCDPREDGNYENYDILLFQLDSDFGNGYDKVMWGDAGIANFFIKENDLKNLNFDNVIYNWDCY